MWNLKQELDAAQSLAKRIEIPTPSGVQVWHVWNQAAGKPLVLLHGGSGSWNHWVCNVLPLSQQRSVWALDTPGLGDSELPLRALDADDLAQPLEEGLQHLFGSMVVRIQLLNFCPKILAVVHFAQMRKFMRNHIVNHHRREMNQTPIQHDIAVACARPPTGCC